MALKGCRVSVEDFCFVGKDSLWLYFCSLCLQCSLCVKGGFVSVDVGCASASRGRRFVPSALIKKIILNGIKSECKTREHIFQKGPELP